MQKGHDTTRLNKIPILEVARVLGLSVKNSKTLCFLHSEKTPSLSFNARTNKWHCFGCGTGGDVINLVMKEERLGFLEACSWLEQTFFGVNTNLETHLTQKQQNTKVLKKIIIDTLIKPDSELYSEVVNHLCLSKKADNYLCCIRALSLDIIRSQHIVSLEDTEAFNAWLNINFEPDRLLRAGFLASNEKGAVYSHWRKPGIVLPYYDINGNIVNMQIRPYLTTEGQKYIFLKGAKTCMYNECSLTNLPLGTEIFLCEGAIDTLSMLTKGYTAVGLPGAVTLKDEWVSMLARFNINIVLDNDETGRNKAAAHKETLEAKNINVKLFNVEVFKDINEMLVAERVD